MNDLEIYQFLKENLYSLVKDESKEEKSFYLGFCHLIHLNYNYQIAPNPIVTFIKSYGNWNGNYYNNMDEITDETDQFIYPVYDWKSRLTLLETALKNYENATK